MKLHNFAKSKEKFGLSQISLLTSSNNKILIQKRSFEVICAIYKKLHNCIFDQANQYEKPENILTIPPDDLMDLLCNEMSIM